MNPASPIVISPEAQSSMVVGVVLAVQLAHWLLGRWSTSVADSAEPAMVVLLSLLISATWVLSSGHPLGLEDAYPVVLLNLTLMAASAAVFGFVRTQIQANTDQATAAMAARAARGVHQTPTTQVVKRAGVVEPE